MSAPAAETPQCRLNLLAEWLEAGAPQTYGVDKFDLSAWHRENECGTVCCLAGAVVQWWGTPVPEPGNDASSEKFYYYKMTHLAQGAHLLGLTESVARQLFIPKDMNPNEMRQVSPYRAGRVVRKFIETGKVDWDGTA